MSCRVGTTCPRSIRADPINRTRGLTEPTLPGFEHSASVINGRFVGLVIDQRTQSMHTEARIDAWLAHVKPLLLEKLTSAA
jgi:hypothetical protein